MRRALGFLTLVGGASTPSPATLPWFPVVGALIGLVVGAVWWGAAQWWGLPVAAALTVVADLVVTGLLHLDGLADAADGLLPPVARERRLEIMRDPRAGVFGVVTVVAVLLVRFAVFASVVPDGRAVLAVAALWATARTAMAVTTLVVPYARDEGLARAFLGGSLVPVLAVALPLVTVLGYLGGDPHLRGLLAVLGAALAATAVVTFARSRLGGFTGDVLGACGVVAETVGLLVLAVRA